MDDIREDPSRAPLLVFFPVKPQSHYMGEGRIERNGTTLEEGGQEGIIVKCVATGSPSLSPLLFCLAHQREHFLSIFSHTSPHDTICHGLNTKLCALDSDSMCSEHFGHVKSGLSDRAPPYMYSTTCTPLHSPRA